MFFEKIAHNQVIPLTDCDEILIESAQYETLEECQDNFSAVMGEVCEGESSANDAANQHAIVIRPNDEKADVQQRMDPSILCCYFVANVNALKQSFVKYNVFGCIKMVSE